MKVALVYDRVNKWGGAERVLLALHELFPNAPLFTAVYHPQKATWAKKFPEVIPTFLNKVSYFRDKHELLGTFTPIAFETLNLYDYDLVISVTSEAAKGVITKPPTTHICYCLTPTRYLWSHYDTYFKGPTFKAVSKPVVLYLRHWDRIAAQRPDVMVAISSAVQKRIEKYYKRESKIIYPPVEVEKFRSKGTGQMRDNFFLVVSRLTPYKRVDLAIEAFNELGFPLVIAGTGREEARLKSMAKKNVEFVGELTDGPLTKYYKRCTALVFPQIEDFGLTAVEAQAAGAPVIAYGKGGALDTVIDPVKAKLTGQAATGVFFNKQDKRSLIGAIKRFKRLSFNNKDLIKNAERFSKERFQKEFLNLVRNVKK